MPGLPECLAGGVATHQCQEKSRESSWKKRLAKPSLLVIAPQILILKPIISLDRHLPRDSAKPCMWGLDLLEDAGLLQG